MAAESFSTKVFLHRLVTYAEVTPNNIKMYYYINIATNRQKHKVLQSVKYKKYKRNTTKKNTSTSFTIKNTYIDLK